MNRTVLSLAAAGAFLVLAFGSAGGSMPTGGMALSGNAGNVDACKSYVSAYNAASCLGGGLAGNMSEADMCPEALNSSPKDMKPYYDCMSAAIACNGEIPDPSYAEKMTACVP